MSDPGQMTQGKPPSYRIMENRISELIGEIATLRQQLADYLRRHKDACDRAMEVVELRQQLAEADNRERNAFIAGYWAYAGPANEAEAALTIQDEEEQWREYKAALCALKESRPEPHVSREMTANERREMERITRELDAEIVAVLNAEKSENES